MDIIARIIDALFGCHHSDFSFPLTPRGDAPLFENVPRAAKATGTYVVCLHCGKEFGYDMERMQILV